MAKSSSHVSQWKHNRALIHLIPASHPDWIVTITFYAALHAVDSLLAHDGVSPITHTDRSRALQKNRRYDKVYRCYDPLYKLSRTVRYLSEPSKWVRYEDIPIKVFEGLLYPIEASIFKLTGWPNDLDKITLASAA